MHAVLLIAVFNQLIAPDPIIDNRMHAYFLRAETRQRDTEKELDQTIDNLEIGIRGEGQFRILQDMKFELRQAKSAREQLRKTKPFAMLPDEPAVGDVGILQPCYVVAVLDGKTAILTQQPMSQQFDERSPYRKKGFAYIVTKADTKPLKMRERAMSQDVWIVMADKSDNESVTRITAKQSVRVLEPIKKSDLERHREMFEKWRANEFSEKAK